MGLARLGFFSFFFILFVLDALVLVWGAPELNGCARQKGQEVFGHHDEARFLFRFRSTNSALLRIANKRLVRAPPRPPLPFATRLHRQVASQLWMLLAYAADSLAVAAQGLIADRVGAGIVPAAREVAGRVRRLVVFNTEAP